MVSCVDVWSEDSIETAQSFGRCIAAGKAFRMEANITVPAAGKIADVRGQQDDVVHARQIVVEFE